MNKIALVTGSTMGIGYGIARSLASRGYLVAINSEDPPAVDDTVQKMSAEGYKVVSAPADVTKSSQVKDMMARLIDEQGQIDILVNNAGNFLNGDILSISEDEWDYILELNLKSVFLTCKAIYPHMLERKWGRIVNVSSVTAFRGALFGEVHYAASKAGIVGFTKTLARTAAPHGITVNAVAPGPVETPMMLRTLKGEKLKKAVAIIPQGRICTLEEVGAAVAYFASDEAAHTTGVTIDLNGGTYMR
jgi:NAD(P)-dependent dehydrogenase (short-subunit alcohol dehydrogenase family)